MKQLIFVFAVIYPFSALAGAETRRLLESWESVGYALTFDTGTIVAQQDKDAQAADSSIRVSVDLELYEGNCFRTSIVTEADVSHLLPPGPLSSQPVSSRSVSATGSYSTRSDTTLLFAARSLKLFADGIDLEDIVNAYGDANVIRQYKLAMSLANLALLNRFNNHGNRSGDRMMVYLPANSGIGGDSADAGILELQRVGRSMIDSHTRVEATLLGDNVEGLVVEFSRSISGRRDRYCWSAVADETGRLSLTISGSDVPIVSGYYNARARNGAGQVVGRWTNLPLNQDYRQVLKLTLAGGAQVLFSEKLDVAREASRPAPGAVSGLAPNHPNPFNANTVIPYRLAKPGAVTLEIRNVLGQKVRTLVDEVKTAGNHRVDWDARDGRGLTVATGVYFIRLTHDGATDTMRLLYLR